MCVPQLKTLVKSGDPATTGATPTRARTHISPLKTNCFLTPRSDRSLGAVLDAVFADVAEVEDLGLARGAAGQKSVAALAQEPLVGVGGQVGADVLLGPCRQPRLEALVEAGAHSLVGLWAGRGRSRSCYRSRTNAE